MHHWPLFFAVNNKQYSVFIAHQPGIKWLSMFYHKGALAVDLFFCLSGFIFYWLYSSKVAHGQVSVSRFLWLRLTRLYPLHVATLLIVAFGQYFFARAFGHVFFSDSNDAKDFLLNMLFIQSWGTENHFSFNIPAWSLSVEIALYAMFFVLCRLLPIRGSLLVLLSLLGLACVSYEPMSRGITSFFMGGFVFFLYQQVIVSRYVGAITKIVGYLTLYAWSATWIANFSWVDTRNFNQDMLLHRWPIFVLFPLSVLTLALIETQKGAILKRLAVLGDISYSIYLLHFPLQLALYAAALHFADNESVFYSLWVMLTFFSVLITLAMLSYRYFELPAQRYLRGISLERLQLYLRSGS